MRAEDRPFAVCLDCRAPLVSTFEFRGKEWWCGVCRKAIEFLHVGWGDPTPERRAQHMELQEQYDRERAERKAAADVQ